MKISLKRIGFVISFLLSFSLFSSTTLAITLEEAVKSCNGKYKGVTPSQSELKEVLVRHEAYLRTWPSSSDDERRANLCGAYIGEVDLSEAHLPTANLSPAVLFKTILSGGNLIKANLGGAYLRNANLNGAHLTETVLSRAELIDADLSGANLRNANLNGARFELKPGTMPDIFSISYAQNLSGMYFDLYPNSLIELREAFKKAGFNKQAREITFAIERSRRMKDNFVESYFRFIFFEVTSGYGMYPGRPLLILFGPIFVFFIPYLIALSITRGRGSIWREWSKDRVLKKDGEDGPVRLSVKWFPMIGFAFYFSVLSAFHLGWRDLNVGSWISKMQPGEYTLRASGWVRTVSGLQSLISVYLLALSVLTYFGTPFD